MDLNRTVELKINNFYEVQEDVGAEALSNAIFYLSTWYTTYNRVIIYSEGGKNLIATYFVDDNWRYTIGAIYDRATRTYSYHS